MTESDKKPEYVVFSLNDSSTFSKLGSLVEKMVKEKVISRADVAISKAIREMVSSFFDRDDFRAPYFSDVVNEALINHMSIQYSAITGINEVEIAELKSNYHQSLEQAAQWHYHAKSVQEDISSLTIGGDAYKVKRLIDFIDSIAKYTIIKP